MKLPYLILIILQIFSVTLTADPPAGYYDSAEGLSGETLKSALHDIISGHTQFSYDDLRDFILPAADEDTLNTDNIILIYTGRSQPKSTYNSGSDGWNREHVWAKSRGDFGNSAPCGTDAHMVHPCDESVNSLRGNKDFDNGGSAVYDLGYLAGYTDADSWEPRDAVKGDVARIIFYMACRYEGESSELDLELVDYIQTLTSNDPFTGKLSSLYQWHLDDPPDSWERLRNDRVYGYQNNRNPFVDHPEYVNYIWGDETPEDNEPPEISTVSVLDAENIVVVFSEYVDQTSAETVSNYQIDNGIGTPLSATLGYNSSDSSVLLEVNSLTPGVSYTITINNIADLHDNVIADNSQYIFEMTSIIEILAESFETGTSGWALYSSASNKDWERTNDTGYAHPNSVPEGNYYMYMNNYGADVAGNDWLISPEIDLTNYTDPQLTFYNWYSYNDTEIGLKVKYSLDYDGSSDPGESTWVTFHESLASQYATWELEEGFDLSDLAGESNIHFAFHYTSSGTGASSCRAWAIDSVILSAEYIENIQLPVPQDLQISYSAGQISLSWQPVVGAVSYNIYSSTDPEAEFTDWEFIVTVTGETTWNTIPAAEKIFYKVTAQ
jgi:endonuclease I